MSASDDPLLADVSRLVRAFHAAAPKDVDARALVLFGAEMVKIGIEQHSRADQPKLWQSVIGDMLDQSR